jgi:hypothetical protein
MSTLHVSATQAYADELRRAADRHRRHPVERSSRGVRWRRIIRARD